LGRTYDIQNITKKKINKMDEHSTITNTINPISLVETDGVVI